MTNYHALVLYGIMMGWIKTAAEMKPEPISKTALMQRLRSERQASGLTSAGTPRKTTPRPELKGLPRREYLTTYMRMLRAERKEHKL